MAILKDINTTSESLDRLQERISRPFDRKIQSPRVQDFAGGFNFVEILDSGAEGERVQLIGNQMPFRPFQGIGGEQKVVKDFYPGNPEPTVQVLGPREAPIRIRGRLYDKRLKDPSLYGASFELAQKIDNMRFKGNLVKISLGEFVRYGYIETARFPLRTLGDLDYEVEFSIIGLTLPTNQNLVSSTKELPFDVNEDLIARLQEEQLANQTKPILMSQTIFERFSGLFSEFVATPINSVTSFMDALFQAREDVDNSIVRAIGITRNARTKLHQYRRRLGLTSYSIPQRDIVEETVTVSFLAERFSAQAELMDPLVRLQAQFEAISQTVPLQRHLVQDGDTLQNLATRFYGNADQWKKIFDHNNLTTTALSLGSILEIPRL